MLTPAQTFPECFQAYPQPAAWMESAAAEIDEKFGLPRFDRAPHWCAQVIAQHYAQHVARERARQDEPGNKPA